MHVLIYGLYDPRDGGLRYIGKAVNPVARLRDHVKEARLSMDHSHRLHWLRDLAKTGMQPTMKRLLRVEPRDASRAECGLIAAYRGLGVNLVNGTDGGEGAPGYRHSEDTKRRLSDLKRGKRLSPERRAEFIAAGKPFTPGDRSTEIRAAISSANKRFYSTAEGKAIQSARAKAAWAARRDMMVAARRRAVTKRQRNQFGRFE